MWRGEEETPKGRVFERVSAIQIIVIRIRVGDGRLTGAVCVCVCVCVCACVRACVRACERAFCVIFAMKNSLIFHISVFGST